MAGEPPGEGDVLLARLPHRHADEQPRRHPRAGVQRRQEQVVLARAKDLLHRLQPFLGWHGKDHQVARPARHLLGHGFGGRLRGQARLHRRDAGAQDLLGVLEILLAATAFQPSPEAPRGPGSGAPARRRRPAPPATWGNRLSAGGTAGRDEPARAPAARPPRPDRPGGGESGAPGPASAWPRPRSRPGRTAPPARWPAPPARAAGAAAAVRRSPRTSVAPRWPARAPGRRRRRPSRAPPRPPAGRAPAPADESLQPFPGPLSGSPEGTAPAPAAHPAPWPPPPSGSPYPGRWPRTPSRGAGRAPPAVRPPTIGRSSARPAGPPARTLPLDHG